MIIPTIRTPGHPELDQAIASLRRQSQQHALHGAYYERLEEDGKILQQIREDAATILGICGSRCRYLDLVEANEALGLTSSSLSFSLACAAFYRACEGARVHASEGEGHTVTLYREAEALIRCGWLP